MPPTTCKALIKDYCENSSFGGIHYIADDKIHWSERCLWLVLVVLSWYGSAILIIAAWDAFVKSPISFGVETIYTDWETKMPAVAICEIANDNKLYNVADTIWTTDHLLDLEDALREIVYYHGQTYRLIDLCYTKITEHCPMSNYSYYADLVRSDCPNILDNCTYNGQPFECCKYFLPINTDMGKCFILNSIQVENPNPYPMVINMKNKRGILRFNVILASRMYTLGEDEVPTITTLQSSSVKIKLGHIYERHVSIKDIENDPLVVQTTPKQRACKFHYENEEGLYTHYSYSACTVLCKKSMQLNTCGCNDHFIIGANDEERCNITGMACLHRYSSNLTSLKPEWAKRPGMACDCIPSCDETEISVVKNGDTINRSDRQKAYVQIVLSHLPTERFKRSVVRSRLDLVVSIGGTAGLFVGASLLSFVELLFYFTIRFVSNIWIDKKRKRLKKQKATKQTLGLENTIEMCVMHI